MRTKRARKTSSRLPGEAGQAMIFVLLAMGLFLVGALAFAVDMGYLWFHRQAAQTAADAACTAGVMDMLATANGNPSGGFTVGTPFKCSGTPGAGPCAYASLNGYNAPGVVAGKSGNEVSIKFPAAVSGVPACTGPTPPAVCSASGVVTSPFIQVNVDDRVSTFFAGLLTGLRTVDVGAQATCGLILSNAPIPLLILNPTANSSFSGNGKIDVAIVGGPQRSIQVNSSSATAVTISGGSGTIDLTKGGPKQTGSDFGVTGSEAAVGIFKTGSTGQWVDPVSAISDPFNQLPAPTQPPAPVRPLDLTALQCPSIPCVVANGVHGCPDTSCYLYTAGNYPSGICVGKGSCTFKTFTTAIFDPGVYYLASDFTANSLSCLRASNGAGDGSGGTMFYFNGGTLNVNSNSGSSCPSAFNTTTGTGSLVNGVKCTPGSEIPSNLPATLSGNVLLAPCTGTYGDPLLTKDPLGEQRGILFFQGRSVSGVQPSWGGCGSFGLVGTMYFHYCNSTDGTGKGTNCSQTAYNDTLSLQGCSGSTSYVVGDIITDKLSIGGNPKIIMDLNPNALYYVLKATLLQ